VGSRVRYVAQRGNRDVGGQDKCTRLRGVWRNEDSKWRRRVGTQGDRETMVAMRCLERRVTLRVTSVLGLRRMRVYERLGSALDASPMDVLGRRERQADHGRCQETRHDRSRRNWHGRGLDLTSLALHQKDNVALNRASRGFRMAVGCRYVAPLFEYRNV
jgi:hypothetical protein